MNFEDADWTTQGVQRDKRASRITLTILVFSHTFRYTVEQRFKTFPREGGVKSERCHALLPLLPALLPIMEEKWEEEEFERLYEEEMAMMREQTGILCLCACVYIGEHGSTLQVSRVASKLKYI